MPESYLARCRLLKLPPPLHLPHGEVAWVLEALLRGLHHQQGYSSRPHPKTSQWISCVQSTMPATNNKLLYLLGWTGNYNVDRIKVTVGAPRRLEMSMIIGGTSRIVSLVVASIAGSYCSHASGCSTASVQREEDLDSSPPSAAGSQVQPLWPLAAPLPPLAH